MDLSEFGGISVSKRPNMFRYLSWALHSSGVEKKWKWKKSRV